MKKKNQPQLQLGKHVIMSLSSNEMYYVYGGGETKPNDTTTVKAPTPKDPKQPAPPPTIDSITDGCGTVVK